MYIIQPRAFKKNMSPTDCLKCYFIIMFLHFYVTLTVWILAMALYFSTGEIIWEHLKIMQFIQKIQCLFNSIKFCQWQQQSFILITMTFLKYLCNLSKIGNLINMIVVYLIFFVLPSVSEQHLLFQTDLFNEDFLEADFTRSREQQLSNKHLSVESLP